MESSEEQPALGSSRATGGVFRGKTEKFSLADASKAPPPPLDVKGSVRLHVSSARSASVSIEDQPEAIVSVVLYQSVKDLLPAVQARYNTLSCMSSHFYCLIMILRSILAAQSVAGRTQSLFMWSFEDEAWITLGPYASAIEDDETCAWDYTGAKPVLHLLLVRYSSS